MAKFWNRKGQIRSKWLGILGVWLCNRYFPRPSTRCENTATGDYVRLMIQSLEGQIPHYGRDRKEGQEPIVCERKDYARIYGKI